MGKRSRRRGEKRERTTIEVTLPDGSRVKVRRTISRMRASNRRKANGTWTPHSKEAKFRSRGGIEHDFTQDYASSTSKVLKRGRLFGMKEGR